MGEVTQLLLQASAGEAGALERVFERLYPELKRMAVQRVGGGEATLSPTALVNEVYLRLIGNAGLSLNDRRHFLACAARAMRAIVIDHVRHHVADKRGGPGFDLPLEAALKASSEFPESLLELDQALDALDAVNARQREVIELHFFAGVGFAEIGELLQLNERTIKRDWERGRAFLYAQMQDQAGPA